MLYDVNELRNQIDNYFCGTLSKSEFGKWAERAYYDLLKGSYVECKKIVLYPFLKTLSIIHVPINDIEDIYPCAEEEVTEIQHILHGEKEYDFQVEMAIPLQVYNMFEKKYFDLQKREVFNGLKYAIFDFISNENENSNKLSECICSYLNVSKIRKVKKETVLDLLEEYIIRLCIILFDIDSTKSIRKTTTKIYSLKTNHDCLIEKLIDYLECYTGNRNFNILVSFRKGMPNIQLLA